MTPWIVAVGARTPVGPTAEATAAAVRAGISRIREHPLFFDALGEPLNCGWDALLDPGLEGAARIAELARSAFGEIADKLGPSVPRGCPLILVLPDRRPGLDGDEEAEVVATLRTFIGSFRLELGPRGHAGALSALERAQNLLRQGAPTVVILAADSYLDQETLHWLDDDNRLTGVGVRTACPPGEAAVALALSSSPPGRSRGANRTMVLLRGVGIAHEPRINSPEGPLGEGLTQALRMAAAGVRLPDEAVDDLYGDVNGERSRTEDWGFSLLRFPELVRGESNHHLVVSAMGDVGAATGALGCLLAARAWDRGYATGPRALIWAGSDSGLRAAAILQKGDHP